MKIRFIMKPSFQISTKYPSHPESGFGLIEKVKWDLLVCAVAPKHDFQCLEHNLYVRSERPAADILGIELNPPFVIDVIAPTYLPKSGNAWPAAEILLDVLAIARHLGRNDRPRSDQTHIALTDVEDLWKLGEAALAQESAARGYARIVREQSGRASCRARVSRYV